METTLEGIWLIDKPIGISSFGIIKKMRRMLGIKKIGHAGTLDPLASGLLIVCSGKFTKQIEGLMGMPKTYTGNFYLGATTACYDLEQAPQVVGHQVNITSDLLHQTSQLFQGEIWQTPPTHSAIKVDGKRAYKQARSGESPELKPRLLRIDYFEITEISLPEVSFTVRCSKGTYIRSLAHDFGQKMGTGAYLSSLRRTKIGPFDIEDAWQLRDLENMLHI